MLGIVVSRADSASTNIATQLRDLTSFTAATDDSVPDADGGGTYYYTDTMELRTFDELHIYLNKATAPFSDLELLVFPSRHAGETGPLLTAHHTGNFGPADYGGEPGQLARACPTAHRTVLDALANAAPPAYDVGMECTHHGPTDLEIPSMFVEIGSDTDQWTDSAAARAVAKAILTLRGVSPDTTRSLVGFGGGHYAPRFDRIRTETEWAIGHIAADWALDSMAHIDPAIIEQAFEKSATTRAIIDGHYPDLAATIADLGYRVVSETWVRETSSIPLDLAAELEETLTPVADGLRFGDAASTAGNYEIVEPAPELLTALNGIDLAKTRAIVADHAVAFETIENGNRIAGRIALPPSATATLVERWMNLLESRHATVARDDDAIVVRSNEFDPAIARELGVPEGPAFGKLANGEPVELDDTTIRPEDVHTQQTVRYAIDRE